MSEEEKLLVKDQVRSQFDEHWAAKRTLVVDTAKIVLPLITIIITALGFLQFFTVDDMKKNADAIEKIKNELTQEVTKTKAEADKAKNEMTETAKLSNAVTDLAKRTSELAVQNSQNVFTSQGKLLETQKELYASVTSASNAALQIIGKTSEVNKVIDKVEEASNKAKSSAENATSANTSASESARAAKELQQEATVTVNNTKRANEDAQKLREKIIGDGEKITELKETNKKLIKLQSSQTFVLKKGQTVELTLPYPDNDGNPIIYKAIIKLGDMKKGIANIGWSIQKESDLLKYTGSVDFIKYPKGEVREKKRQYLQPSPFVLELEHLNAARLAPDFVILVIRSI